MPEQLLSNARRVEKHLTTPGFELLTSQSINKITAHSAIKPLLLLCCNQFYISNKLYCESNRDLSKTKNERVKKTLEKSKNVLEDKRKTVKQKNCIQKINTFAIIVMNFVQKTS